MKSSKISVVIPVLNEEKTLRNTLGHLSLSGDEELIVADGGSTDDSVSIARQFTDQVFVTTSGRGRGHAMNYGAARARGDILLFLHADCRLPEGAFDAIRRVLCNDGVAAGAFDLAISDLQRRFRVIEKGANLRSRVTSIPYGDQGIFMRKDYFDRLGGYADIALMEDIEFSRRLKKIGKIVFLRTPIRTSARRWLSEGVIHTTVRDWVIALCYSFLRISPGLLKHFYRDVR